MRQRAASRHSCYQIRPSASQQQRHDACVSSQAPHAAAVLSCSCVAASALRSRPCVCASMLPDQYMAQQMNVHCINGVYVRNLCYCCLAKERTADAKWLCEFRCSSASPRFKHADHQPHTSRQYHSGCSRQFSGPIDSRGRAELHRKLHWKVPMGRIGGSFFSPNSNTPASTAQYARACHQERRHRSPESTSA